jgi:nucleoid DNA-binding protein
MLITREILVKRLSEESGYWQKDVRALLQCMDDVILEFFGEATDDEGVSIQLVQGVKIGCSIQPERERRDPRTQQSIICAPTCKPNAKFSQDFRNLIQKQYEEKKGS